MKLEGLIGKRFRRHKYGLTPWEKVIESVDVEMELVAAVRKHEYIQQRRGYFEAVQKSKDLHGATYRVVINGKYYLDEIIIYG